MITSLSALQLLKIELLIVFIEAGNSALVNAVQLSNAYASISVTLPGMTISGSPVPASE